MKPAHLVPAALLAVHCGGNPAPMNAVPDAAADTGADVRSADVPAAVDVRATDTGAMHPDASLDASLDASADVPVFRDVPVADVPVADVPRDAGAPVDAGPPGALQFDAPVEWTALGTSYRIAGDITGDGLRDAVLVDTFSPVGMVTVTFAVAQASGAFVPAGSFAVAGYSGFLDYADFDGDHHVDVLLRVQSASTPNSYIARGRGDGTFAPLETLPFTATLAGDFDHDGRADLVEASSFGTVSMHLRQASGAFTTVATTLSPSGAGVTTGDFDGDGTPDLAAGTTVYRSTGGGHFGAGIPAPCSDCASPTRILVARLDGDARDDMVVATSTSIVVLLAQPGGGMQRLMAYPVPRAVQLAAADLDGDGHTDLAVVGEPTGTTSDDLLALFYGDGTGAFPDVRNYLNTRWNSILPVLTDADRDGRMDVVLEGRFVAYGRGSRRIRAPELSVYTPGSTARGQVTRLDGPGAGDVVVPSMTANVARWHFDATRRLGAMSTCTGAGSGPYRGFDDLTGDGRADAFAFAGGTLSVWPGLGGCTFGPEHRSALTAYAYMHTRVDGDALEDLVFTTTGGLGVSLQTAAGDFGAPVVSAFTGSADYVVAADFNRDHFVDALVVDNSAHRITVFNGDAARHLTAGMQFSTGSEDSWYPKAADVDADGDTDVVYVNHGANQLALLRNDGTGTLAREMLGAIDSVAEIAVGDLDNDGHVEIVAADNQLAISVWRVDAHGASRLMHVQVPRGQFPFDADGDGDLDLVYFDAYSGSAVVAVTNNRVIDR